MAQQVSAAARAVVESLEERRVMAAITGFDLYTAGFDNDVRIMSLAATGSEYNLGSTTDIRRRRVDVLVRADRPQDIDRVVLSVTRNGTPVLTDREEETAPYAVGRNRPGTLDLLGKATDRGGRYNLFNVPAGERVTFRVEARAFVGGAVASQRSTTFVLSNTAGGTVTPPSLRVGNASQTEGDGPATVLTFPVTLSKASDRDVTVRYATVDGSARAGLDYVSTSGTLTIRAGQTSANLTVLVSSDQAQETTEQFQLRLSNPTNATIAGGTGTGTIRDDDDPGQTLNPAFRVGDVAVEEGNSGQRALTFTVRRTEVGKGPVSVRYAVVQGTAAAGSDYVPAAGGVLTFAAGQATRTVTVQVRGDQSNEGDEQLRLELSDPTGGATIADASAVGTIRDDDDDDGPQLRPTVTSVRLVDRGGNTVQNINLDGSTRITGLGNRAVSLVVAGERIGSVNLDLYVDGVGPHVENYGPFSLYGDQPSGYTVRPLTRRGTFTLNIDAFTGKRLTGAGLDTTVKFQIIS